MAKKQSGIAYGQKNLQRGANDTSILISLKTFLRQEFLLEFKREWYVGFDKEYGNLCRIAESIGKAELQRFKWKNPDLLCVSNEFGIIIVELDGAIHDRKVQKTVERNVLFRGAGIKLIVLNIADIKEFGETIKDHLSQEMKKIVG
jgi:hypothetical protein|tara:strand:+ start:136 stop:573 length:438 start_codon:yes stop_codon:yes gene_type:complete